MIVLESKGTLATPVVSEGTPYNQHNYLQCHIRFLHGSRAERTSHKISKNNDLVSLDYDHCWGIYFCEFWTNSLTPFNHLQSDGYPYARILSNECDAFSSTKRSET